MIPHLLLYIPGKEKEAEQNKNIFPMLHDGDFKACQHSRYINCQIIIRKLRKLKGAVDIVSSDPSFPIVPFKSSYDHEQVRYPMVFLPENSLF